VHPGLCTWQGPGNPSHAERATVSFSSGHIIQIDIDAATSGTSEKFTPGQLSKWATGKNIHLGSTRASVKRATPAAKANNSTGVAGWDLFNAATRHFTRFSSFGVGATPDRLRYIELACTVAGKCWGPDRVKREPVGWSRKRTHGSFSRPASRRASLAEPRRRRHLEAAETPAHIPPQRLVGERRPRLGRESGDDVALDPHALDLVGGGDRRA
jgi:hypothetical protein